MDTITIIATTAISGFVTIAIVYIAARYRITINQLKNGSVSVKENNIEKEDK